MFILALLILGSFIIAFGSFLNALLFCIVWIAILVLLGIFLGKKYGTSIESTMESVMHIGVIGGILWACIVGKSALRYTDICFFPCYYVSVGKVQGVKTALSG